MPSTMKEKFHNSAGTAAAMVFVTVVVLLVGFGLARPMWLDAQARFAQTRLNESVSKTAPGQFAVENFRACKNTGGVLSSPASDALCVTQTVDGAEKLKGSAFAAQVTQELAGWLEQSKTLRAQ